MPVTCADGIMSQAFIALFFQPPPKPHVIKAAAGRKRKRTDPVESAEELQSPTPTSTTPLPESNDTSSSAAEEMLEDYALFPSSETQYVDPARVAHDVDVVSDAVSQANSSDAPISKKNNTPLSAAQLRAQKAMAVGIFPKVAGLARRIGDSPTLKAKFDKLVDQQRQETPALLPGTKTRLDRRCPTRWNSDLTCLSAHVFFLRQIRTLVGAEANLEQYSLSDEQEALARELERVLQVNPSSLYFEDVTDYCLLDLRGSNGTLLPGRGAACSRDPANDRQPNQPASRRP